MSALGQKQTPQTVMSALPLKADMCCAIRDVSYGPKGDIGRLRPVTLDGVPVCVNYDVDGTEFFCTYDLHHRHKSGRYKNYFFKFLQRSSR
jgi:hypothetical protein